MQVMITTPKMAIRMNPKWSRLVALAVALGTPMESAKLAADSVLVLGRALVYQLTEARADKESCPVAEVGRLFTANADYQAQHEVGKKVIQLLAKSPGAQTFSGLADWLESGTNTGARRDFERTLLRLRDEYP